MSFADLPAPSCLAPNFGNTGRILSRQGGAVVTRHDNFVIKKGRRVKPNEEAALRLVHRLTDVPVPTVYDTLYAEEESYIRMSWVDGEVLDRIWDDLDCNKIKERICRHTWELIYLIRNIPKPAGFKDYFQCGADGTASHDVLIAPLPHSDPGPLRSDQDLRQRLYERYFNFHGRRYETELPDMLPRSEKTVFTHADIAPRNIMIADNYDFPVVAIVDWEFAGWYPEYWEYGNIMRPSKDQDWKMWMEYTAPEKWDISGIAAARRVLF